jgi:hypothetical protein
MLEEIDGWDLIPGEFYNIKSHTINIRKARMIRYMNITYKEATGIFDTPYGKFLIELYSWTFYRYVSPEEYNKKVKEKYDATCLDIVLKRLVNETFTW